MALSRLTFTLERLDQVPSVLATSSDPLSVCCVDATTVVAVASIGEQLGAPLGLWLNVTAEYPGALIARDVKTLSWLVDLAHVVISAPRDALQHAEVVAALLTNDQVNFTNHVARLEGAYNRPAPPRPVVIWSFDGTHLRHGEYQFAERVTRPTAAGDVTQFA